MNSGLIGHIIRFLLVLLAQVIICNNINFFGFINPYIYIIFILTFPIKTNRIPLLLISFVLGLGIDMFTDSGGIHAAASVLLAYIRPILLKTVFGTLYENQMVKFYSIDVVKLLGYFALGTLIHHLVLFTLEIFNFSHIIIVLKKTLFSGLFTIVLSVLLFILFRRSKG